MKNIFYVYLLLDPRNFYVPFYVGKGKGKRSESHLKKNSATINSFKENVIKAIRREGLEPVILLWETQLLEQDAFQLEMDLIKRFGRRNIKTGILTNLTNGGEGTSGFIYSAVSKNTMSKSQRKRASDGRQTKHSAEYREFLKKQNAGGIATSKPIFQIGEDGFVIKEWPSFKKAKKELGLSGDATEIHQNGCYKRMGSFWWRLVGSTDVVDGHLVDIEKYKAKLAKPKNGRPVAQLDIGTKRILKIWDSTLAAACEFGVSQASIWQAASRNSKSCGYMWSFIDNGHTTLLSESSFANV